MAGWDFILDFPMERLTDLKSDIQAPPIECKVQIKSTNKDRKSSSIKLSNLLRFAKSPLPTFFVFIEYNNKPNPENIYIIHFDSQLITNTLKRVREIEQSSAPKKLNASTIKINYDDSHKLPSLTGIELKKTIEQYIPEGMSSYTEKKLEFCKTVGFETGSASIKFTTSGEESLTTLVEAMLGIEKEVTVNNVVINETRFGIAAKNPLSQSPTALLKFIPVNFLDIQISFYRNKYETPLSFKAKFYMTPLHGFVPKELEKARIQGEFFEILLPISKGTWTYSFNLNQKKMKIKDLLDSVHLVNLMFFSEDGLSCEIKPNDNNIPKVEVKWGRVPTYPNQSKEDWGNQLKELSMAYDIICLFDLQDRLFLTIEDINKSLSEIRNLHRAYHTDIAHEMFTLEPIDNYDEELLTKEHCFIYGIPVNIGEALMVVVFSFFGYIKKTNNDKFQMTFNKKIIEHKYSIANDDDKEDFSIHIQSRMKELESEYIKSGYIMIKLQK